MGFSLGGIFSKGSAKGSSVANTDMTSTQAGASTSQASSQSTTQQSSMDAASKLLLDSLSKQLSASVSAGVEGFSKADALNDVQGVVSNIFKSFKETALPAIVNTMGAAGAYNSTGAQALADNAFAQATAQAAETSLKAISDYAGIETSKQNSFMQGLLNALQLQSEATKGSTTSDTGSSTSQSNIVETTKGTTTENTKGKSSSMGLNFGLGGK